MDFGPGIARSGETMDNESLMKLLLPLLLQAQQGGIPPALRSLLELSKETGVGVPSVLTRAQMAKGVTDQLSGMVPAAARGMALDHPTMVPGILKDQSKVDALRQIYLEDFKRRQIARHPGESYYTDRGGWTRPDGSIAPAYDPEKDPDFHPPPEGEPYQTRNTLEVVLGKNGSLPSSWKTYRQEQGLGD